MLVGLYPVINGIIYKSFGHQRYPKPIPSGTILIYPPSIHQKSRESKMVLAFLYIYIYTIYTYTLNIYIHKSYIHRHIYIQYSDLKITSMYPYQSPYLGFATLRGSKKNRRDIPKPRFPGPG